MQISALLPALIFAVAALFLSAPPLCAGPRQPGPVEVVSLIEPREITGTPIQGELQVFTLDNRTLVVAGLYDDFFNRMIRARYNERLGMADKLLAEKKLPEWSYRFYYNFATIDSMSLFWPQIAANFQNPAYFQIKVDGQPAIISENGYWINAVGCKVTPFSTKPGTALTNSAELIPFAYLILDTPLKNGQVVAINTRNNEKVSFTYDDRRLISRAIKVNQVGYAPEAGQKYAYLGFWLGSLGAMDIGSQLGEKFYIIDSADGQAVYQGNITLRKQLQSTLRDKTPVLLDGEKVAELNFSNFNRIGKFYLYIPGVGRSWEFEVGPDALGRAFYVQTRGLFHQRSGIEKSLAHTRWDMGADHKISYRGGFMPDDRQYQGPGSCLTDANGKRLSIRHFEVVKATATNEALPEVYGGWWDAGDFDRRSYHFEIVDCLLSVYLLFPENFSDSQLDIPESGNGIPDIVDEAAWGVDLWRRAQNAAGGVGCWLEATSHPENPDPVVDTQRYYLALPTRGSSLQYSIYAAKLARAYRRCGAMEQAELFYNSAVRAFDYAMDEKNQARNNFELPKQGKVFYTEPLSLPPEQQFKAALNLYLYDRSEKYAEIVDKINFDSVLEWSKNNSRPYYLSELIEEKTPFFTNQKKYSAMIRKKADELLKSQDELTYRNINWPLNHRFFFFMSWGAGLPTQKGGFFIMAWRIDRKNKYRDAALLCVDWMLGTNPMGRSMTTGLGKVYPIKILSLPMWAWHDRLKDPIPGITPYTFTGRSNYAAAEKIFNLHYKMRPDHKFSGVHINLLPQIFCNGKSETTQSECYSIIRDKLPLWRSFANLEGYAVDQNEFSVWETIAPAAAMYGALLTPGWRPPVEWKNVKPVKELKDLPGYIFLP
ncbi:MAG: glycoside hydrolase family 9 protein [Lentisphaeria bacterium]|nr:glycoside hydrolase family 9 protein [Lentisphaeria bacterium]